MVAEKELKIERDPFECICLLLTGFYVENNPDTAEVNINGAKEIFNKALAAKREGVKDRRNVADMLEDMIALVGECLDFIKRNEPADTDMQFNLTMLNSFNRLKAVKEFLGKLRGKK